MKIAMLAWESLHSVSVGGGAVAVSELSAALERRGHDVHVFTRLGAEQKHYEVVDGVHYHRCPYVGADDFVQDINQMCSAFADRVLAVEDMTGQFDLVHAHDWLAVNAMIWIKSGRGHASVFQVHSTEYARCGNSFPGGRAAEVRQLEWAGGYHADLVFCVSETTKSEVEWMYAVPPEKTEVLYNGVSSARFDVEVDAGAVKQHYGISPLDPMVLFCGRMEWQKGPDLLVEAVPSVLSTHPNTKFVFAGSGGMMTDMQNRAMELGIQDAVRFLGFKGGRDLVELFHACDISCVPSRNEPFGIVVLEAWCASKPVLVTNIGGPDEFVDHDVTGVKITPSPESITWGLSHLMSDFDAARAMGRRGHDRVAESFSWDQVASRAESLYLRIAPESAKPIELAGSGGTGTFAKTQSKSKTKGKSAGKSEKRSGSVADDDMESAAS